MGIRSFVEHVKNLIASAPLSPIYLPDYIEARNRLRRFVPSGYELVFQKRVVSETGISWQPITARPEDPDDPHPLRQGTRFYVWDGYSVLEELATVLRVEVVESADPRRFDGQWVICFSVEPTDEDPVLLLSIPETVPFSP